MRATTFCGMNSPSGCLRCGKTIVFNIERGGGEEERESNEVALYLNLMYYWDSISDIYGINRSIFLPASFINCKFIFETSLIILRTQLVVCLSMKT